MSLVQLRNVECSHSCGEHLWKFIVMNKSIYIRRELNIHRIGLVHQHSGIAEVSLSWKITMAVVRSCEYSLYLLQYQT